MVNVGIHEPLIQSSTSTPPPTVCERRSGSLAGERDFKATCAAARAQNQTIYPITKLCVDPNRTMVNTRVSRYGLAALDRGRSALRPDHQGSLRRRCLPKGAWQRGSTNTSGHAATRADGTTLQGRPLRGIWARRVLHNGRYQARAADVPVAAAGSIPARQPLFRRALSSSSVGAAETRYGPCELF